ncbi:MAG: Rne/Rng family ribonuclease [Clostridia bacterium]|nr:Rne/Rng family ribonuclease [Clostridia bacterium]
MSKEIVSDINFEQTRVALLEDGDLVEIYIERHDNRRIVGNIYKGKVSNVLSGMQAAFVDIGLDKNAFLYIGDIATDKSVFEFENSQMNIDNISITDVLRPGQEIVVQVVKEPIERKGPRITTNITIPGKYLVLMPTVNHTGVSKRIQEEDERNRLKLIAEKIKRDDIGIIVRTAARNKTEEELKKELSYLESLWENIKQKIADAKAPSTIYQDENLMYRIFRDIFCDDIDKFVINDRECYQNICDYARCSSPELVDRIIYSDNIHIFDEYNIESKILKAINRKVWLDCGGYLVIDQTEALTVIDVNTGKFVGSKNLEDTVFITNLQAAKEIAKQLRLRDIGGIIIIDFIDMEVEQHQNEVLELLKQSLEKDRTKTNVLGITKLGLVEITRKKIRQRIRSVLQKPCPYCEGTGKVFSEETMVIKVKRKISKLFADSGAEAVLIEVYPDVASMVIGQNGEGLLQLENQFKGKVYIKGNYNLHIEDIKIKAIGDDKAINSLAMPVKQGEILYLNIEGRHVAQNRNGIGRIDGYIVDVENAGNLVGKRVKIKIEKVFRTYAKAIITS